MSDLRAKKILLAFKEMIDAGVIEVKLDEDLEDWAEQIATYSDDDAEPSGAPITPPAQDYVVPRDADLYYSLREYVESTSWPIVAAPAAIPEPVDDPESRRVNDELWDRRMSAYRDFVARSQNELRPRTGRQFRLDDPSTEDG